MPTKGIFSTVWRRSAGGLALLTWIAWTGRQHFRDVWEKAVSGPRAAAIDDSGEMFSYRATILGLAISYGGIALWMYAAGVPALYTLSSLLMLTLALTVISWLVSQAGMLFAQQPYGTVDMVAPTLGTSWLNIPALYTLTRFEFSFLFDTREMLTPSLLMGGKSRRGKQSQPALFVSCDGRLGSAGNCGVGYRICFDAVHERWR